MFCIQKKGLRKGVQALLDFQYVEPNGKDQGINVRRKAQSLLALLNDRGKIRELRQKSAANRDKYVVLFIFNWQKTPGSLNSRTHKKKNSEIVLKTSKSAHICESFICQIYIVHRVFSDDDQPGSGTEACQTQKWTSSKARTRMQVEDFMTEKTIVTQVGDRRWVDAGKRILPAMTEPAPKLTPRGIFTSGVFP